MYFSALHSIFKSYGIALICIDIGIGGRPCLLMKPPQYFSLDKDKMIE
jgi:hypothetical protein